MAQGIGIGPCFSVITGKGEDGESAIVKFCKPSMAAEQELTVLEEEKIVEGKASGFGKREIEVAEFAPGSCAVSALPERMTDLLRIEGCADHEEGTIRKKCGGSPVALFRQKIGWDNIGCAGGCLKMCAAGDQQGQRNNQGGSRFSIGMKHGWNPFG